MRRAIKKSIFVALVLGVGVAAVSLLPPAGRLEASIFVTGNIPPGGIQQFSGPLGDDFTVTNNLKVTDFGVFDAGQDPLQSTITGYIYPLGGGTPLLTVTFSAGTSYANSPSPYVWQTLATPLTLVAGQSYTLVAEGFGGAQPDSNTNNGSTVTFSQVGYTLDQSRFGYTPGLYPDLTPNNSGYPGNWHFGDANIEYIPEPLTIVIWSVLGVLAIGVGWWPRKRAA
ncbi:MAG: hypothetical protein ABSG68_00395 [Thermoguttaceae bacterium]|jgi:hypothetical protein